MTIPQESERARELAQEQEQERELAPELALVLVLALGLVRMEVCRHHREASAQELELVLK